MTQYKIHPIVVGTKIFDKTMMTYQYGYGQTYTIPIYCWYLEGGDQNILVDTGEMKPIYGVALIVALLNSRSARRRGRFNRASHCDVPIRQRTER